MTKSQIIIHIEVDFQINLWYNMHLSLGVSVKEKYNNSKIYRIKKHEENTKITINQVLCVLICIESLICGFFIYKLATRKQRHIETLENIEMSLDMSTNYVRELLTTAVNNNKNLNSDEKLFIVNNIPVFVEYKDYIDVNYLKDKLSTLKIVYKKTGDGSNGNVRTKGEYNHFTNIITFYNAKSIEKVEPATFTHELFHVMQKTHYRDRNEYLIETVNTIFNENNTERQEKTLYSNYFVFTKMLIEVIGNEPFNKFQGYTTHEPIVDALVEICGTKKDACVLLDNLNEYKRLYDKMSNDFVHSKRYIDKLGKIKKDIIKRISIYYEKKYGFSMENDLIMLYYYDYNRFIEKISERYFIESDDIVIREADELNYFNRFKDSKLIVYARGPIKQIQINIYPNGTSSKKDNIIEDYNIIVEINNENRYLNNVKKLVLDK